MELILICRLWYLAMSWPKLWLEIEPKMDLILDLKAIDHAQWHVVLPVVLPVSNPNYYFWVLDDMLEFLEVSLTIICVNNNSNNHFTRTFLNLTQD
jgi:hypothetical protein